MKSQAWLGFYGAAGGGVTGSRTLLTAGSKKVLIDCGLFQGTQDERQRNWQPFPFDHTTLDGMVLTHAHLDHSGAVPLAVRRGFTGPIYCTSATAGLLEIMLKDSGRLQEEEAEFRNRRGWTKHKPALPLYTEDDAEKSLGFVRVVDFGVPFHCGDIEFSFHPAGHILGSSHVLAKTETGASVLFSGDIGRGDHLLLDDAPPRPGAATVICEATYGDRRHPAIDAVDELQAALSPVLERGGVALIPAFAVGRAQELLAALEVLFADDRLERVPVFLDSPMAAKTLALTKEEEAELSGAGRERLAKALRHTRICAAREQSMKLNALHGPAIIIAGSGMLTGGRILHHVSERAHRQDDALILTGFQARGTRGRRIADGEDTIKIFGQPVELKLEVRSLSAFSAHADQEGLLNWLAQGKAPQRVILNHGERTAVSAFVQAVRAKFRSAFPVVAAQYGARYDLVPDVQEI